MIQWLNSLDNRSLCDIKWIKNIWWCPIFVIVTDCCFVQLKIFFCHFIFDWIVLPYFSVALIFFKAMDEEYVSCLDAKLVNYDTIVSIHNVAKRFWSEISFSVPKTGFKIGNKMQNLLCVWLLGMQYSLFTKHPISIDITGHVTVILHQQYNLLWEKCAATTDGAKEFEFARPHFFK